MTQHLTDGHAGQWIVQTDSSTYQLDLDARTLQRLPNRASATRPASLRRDGDALTLWQLVQCRIGHPMVALIQIRDDDIPTQRITTAVRAITPHADAATEPATPIPEWARHVRPGTVDTKVLYQDQIWVSADSHIHRVSELTPEHAHNILTMLHRAAQKLHLNAILTAVEAEVEATITGALTAERLTNELTGTNIATVNATDWLESLPLIRALRRRTTTAPG